MTEKKAIVKTTGQIQGTAITEHSRSRRFKNDNLPWYKQLRWGDLLMYVLISMTAIGLLLSANPSGANTLQIAILSEDGRLLFSKPITELQIAGSFAVEAMGFHYRISYQGGQIRFAEADCPDKVCVRTGWVSRSGQVSACVPGHLILKITGPATNSTNDIDIILQ
jgi:hypothetical protein